MKNGQKKKKKKTTETHWSYKAPPLVEHLQHGESQVIYQRRNKTYNAVKIKIHPLQEIR